MTEVVVLTAAVPWGKVSELTGHSYRPGDIANLRGKVLLGSLHAPNGKELLYGVATRGRATPSAYRLEFAVLPYREEARRLLAEIDDGYGPPHISPGVQRRRLVGVGCRALVTWAEAALRRSHLPPTPEAMDRVLALLASEGEASRVG